MPSIENPQISTELLRQATVDAIEQFYHLNNDLPTLGQLQIYLGTPDWLTEEFWLGCLETDTFQKSLKVRGLDKLLPLDKVTGFDPPVGVLTGLQFAVVNLILDTHDKRTIGQKLKALGVTTSLYKSWLKDKSFKAYYDAMADKLFGEQLPEIHQALHKRALSGDVNAVKLVYNVTGYWTDKPDQEYNPLWIISQVMGVLQRNLSPSQLEPIASDLINLVESISGRGAGSKMIAPVVELEPVIIETTPVEVGLKLHDNPL